MRWQWFVLVATVFTAHLPAEAAAQRFGGRLRTGSATDAAGDKRSKPEQLSSASKNPAVWVGMKVMPRTPTVAFGLQDTPGGHASDVSPWPQIVRKVSGHWLWIESPGVAGWISAQDVVPLADAIRYFNGRIARQKNTWDLYMRGSALREQERFDETYKDFKVLEKLEEQEFAALTKQVSAQRKRNDYHGLIATATRMARLIPSNVTIYTTRGAAYLALNDTARAKADFDHAVELAASTETYAARANFYRLQGDIALAIEDLDKAIYHWPLVRLYEERAECLMLQDDYARAIDDLNVVLANNPQKVENYLLRARANLAIGHTHEGNLDCSTAIRLAPKAETYQQIAACRYDCRQFTQAIDDSSLAIRLDPKLAAAYAVRGRAFAEIQREDEALADFNSALRLKPWGDAETYLFRAQLYWRRAEIEQCLSDVRDATQLGVRTAASLLLKAAALIAQGDHENAIASLNVTVQRYPVLREAYELRSVAHWIAGNDQQAQADCAAARQLTQTARLGQFSTKKPVDQLLNCPTDLRRAMFLSDIGFRSLAIDLADQAIERLPSQVDGYRVRGVTHFFRGDYLGARQDFEVVLARNPDDAEIQAKHDFCRLCLDPPEGVIAEMNRQLGLRGPSFGAFFARAWAWGKLHEVDRAVEDATDALTFANEADPRMIAECYMLRSSLGRLAPAKADRQRAEELQPGINQHWDERQVKRAREQAPQSDFTVSRTDRPSGGETPDTIEASATQLDLLKTEFSLDSAQPGWYRGSATGP